MDGLWPLEKCGRHQLKYAFGFADGLFWRAKQAGNATVVFVFCLIISNILATFGAVLSPEITRIRDKKI